MCSYWGGRPTSSELIGGVEDLEYRFTEPGVKCLYSRETSIEIEVRMSF